MNCLTPLGRANNVFLLRVYVFILIFLAPFARIILVIPQTRIYLNREKLLYITVGNADLCSTDCRTTHLILREVILTFRCSNLILTAMTRAMHNFPLANFVQGIFFVQRRVNSLFDECTDLRTKMRTSYYLLSAHYATGIDAHTSLF